MNLPFVSLAQSHSDGASWGLGGGGAAGGGGGGGCDHNFPEDCQVGIAVSSKLKEMFNVCRKFPEKLRRRSSAYFEPERRESVKSIRLI